MSKPSVWDVVPEGSTWTVVWPGNAARVGGFDSKEDAHTWIMDYLVEALRTQIDSAAYAAERGRERDWRRKLQAAVLLDPGPEKKA